jgi:hypothetical protein
MRSRSRFAVVVYFAVLCVVLCVLWVRSYRFRDEANYRYWPDRVVELVSMGGRLEFRDGSPFGNYTHWFYTSPIQERQYAVYSRGFDSGSTGSTVDLTTPYWALVLFSSILTALLARPYLPSTRDLFNWLGDENGDKRPRLKFSLRTMLGVVFIIALLLWGGRAIYDFWNTRPTVNLADVVREFNASAPNDPVGELQPALSVDEVLSSIQEKLPTLGAIPEKKRLYEQIVGTSQAPIHTRIRSISGYNDGHGPTKAVWWIDIDVPGNGGRLYDLRVRENNNPIVSRTPP